MKPLQFEGYSDDTFGEYGRTKDDYDNCASGEPIYYLVLAGDGTGLVVSGQYCPDGVTPGWVIGVGTHDPVGEDVPIPEWPMRIERGEKGYSPRLVIEAPEDVDVVCLNRKSGDE